MMPFRSILYSIGFLSFIHATTAQTTFTNVSPALNLTHICQGEEMGGGGAFLDYNNDGWLDIYVTGEAGPDVLYRNNGNGTFTDVSAAAGITFTDTLNTMGVAAGDIDNDGYPEIFVSTTKGHPSILFKNNGNGTFQNIATTAGITDTSWNYSATFGDYNKDGFLDLYVGNYVETPGFILDSMQNTIGFDHICSSNNFYLNNGNGTFTDIINTLNLSDTACNLATTFTDFDNDNDLDIYNANDFGRWEHPNDLFLNNYPNNTYSDISVSSNMDARMYGMGIAIGDYDQDLDLDYYVTNIGRNILMRNNNDGTFTDTATAAGVENTWITPDTFVATGWGTGFLDVDNDSYLDLFVVNGYIQTIEPVWLLDPDKLYYNNGDGTFSDISDSAGVSNTQMSRGFAFGDYDNDGDNDMLVVPIKDLYLVDTVPILLYQNNLNNSNNWLEVKLQGTVSNRDAIGAHMIIYVGNQHWLHEVMPSGSHGSQNGLVAHFGLGQATTVDSLEIIWPNGGRQTEYNITANQILTIVEGNFTANHLIPLSNNSHQLIAFPNPSKGAISIDYKLAQSSNIALEITNSMGQVVWNKTMGFQTKGNYTVAFNSNQEFSAGIYLLNLKTDQTILSKKLILH